jgi:regulatory protein
MDKPENMITAEQAFERMARLCSQKECCTLDVSKKLRRMQMPEETVADIIARLRKERYIDEVRYTRSYIHDKLTFNKWGKKKIVLSLQQKQIPAHIIEDAFSQFSDTTLNASLLPLLEAKRKTVKGKSAYEINGKLIRYALARGFAMQEILACMRKININELPDATE